MSSRKSSAGEDPRPGTRTATYVPGLAERFRDGGFSNGHDFKRDGARTVAKRRVGRVVFWIEESASAVLGYSRSYGLHWVRDRWGWTANLGFGRFHLVAHLDTLAPHSPPLR